MLELSHQEIVFQWKQMKKSLMLTNNSESSIIYKVKTNVLNLIVATPSKGYIQPKKTLSIQIKCQKQQVFEVKLQVIYCMFEQMKSTIDETWNSISKNEFKHKMIYLSKEQAVSKVQEKSEKNLKQEKQNQKSASLHSSMSESGFNSQNNSKLQHFNIYQTKKQKKQSLKMIQSITTPISQKSQKQQHKHFIKKTKICQANQIQEQANKFQQEVFDEQMKKSKNTVVSQNNNFLHQNFNKQHNIRHTIQSSSYNYMNHSQLVKLAMLQQQLLKQKQINQKLSKKLIKTNQLRKQRYQYEMQTRINHSMQACSEDHFGIGSLFVICIIFFTVGFLIAKF